VRVLTVLGTRPEAVKLAPVIHALKRTERVVEAVVCSTGQHRDMLAPLWALLDVRPDVELAVMREAQTLGGLTARLFAALAPIIRKTRPDWLLAQGDTTTALVTAMLAYYEGICFAHVEAGLRTGHLRRPFPEEMNRRVADMVADLCFAPTELARDRLLAEGVPADRVLITGNTVVDTLLHAAALPYAWEAGPLYAVPRNGRLVLVTAHRRESFGGALCELCRAVRMLAERFAADGVTFVYPVHPNPNVRASVGEVLAGVRNIILLEPLDYISFVNLLQCCSLVITDSGGVQEEAPSFRVPLLVARDATERTEGLRAGVARLVGTKLERIVAEATVLLTDPAAHAAMATGVNPYGDGRAAERIVAALLASEQRLADPLTLGFQGKRHA
jgi:UDP-N-acetylglucosamine 2-epimerase